MIRDLNSRTECRPAGRPAPIARFELVTPEVASSYLDRNVDNRRQKAHVINDHASMMAHDQWYLTHQGIAFDWDGNLMDGQHRLQAIVKSGIAQTILVVTGLDPASRIAMDEHCRRSAGDSIRLARGIQLTTGQVAIIRCVHEFGGQNEVLRNAAQVADAFSNFIEPLEFVHEFVKAKAANLTAAPIWAAVVLAWFYADDLARLHKFASVFRGHTYMDGDEDAAAVLLREWVLKSKISSARPIRQECFLKTQKAIQAFLDRKAIRKLYATEIVYPWPLVLPTRVSGMPNE